MFFFTPSYVQGAEVLQVRSSSLIQVGDNNRTYTVQLPCLDVYPLSEKEAKTWLKTEVPRRRKVNLRPEGNKEGTLLARVTPLGRDTDLSTGMIQKGLAKNTCIKK